MRKCKRCRKEYEFNEEHREIISMSAECRAYNPNQLCKEFRPFSKRG
jgi:hypothetical protein